MLGQHQRVNYVLLTIVLDILCLIGAILIAQRLRATVSIGPSVAAPETFPPYVIVLILLIWNAFFIVFSVHIPEKNYRFIVEAERLLLASCFSLLTLAGALYFSYRTLSRLLIIYFFLASVALLIGWRLIVYIARRLLRVPSFLRPRGVIIVGSSDLALQVAERIQEYAWTGLNLRGLVDDPPLKAETSLPLLGSLADLREVILSHNIEEVVIALRDQSYDTINDIVAMLQELPVRIRVVPGYFSLALFRATVEDFGGMPLINLRDPALSSSQRLVKRIFDLVIGSLSLVVALPVMALIAVAIRLDSPGPILFKQERIGENGRPFTVYKFRSMYVDAEQRLEELRNQNEASGPLFKVRDDPRRTRVGRFIRTTSIDEIPQFLNVLRGEMSIVGPRPGLPNEVAQYQEWHHKRLQVLPGITGMWQVSGRSNLTFDEMVMLDIYYAENWSLSLDLRIMLRTIPQILFGDGAY